MQKRLKDLYMAEGQRQSMMVEVIHGMRTIKALAIEPAQRRLWDQRSAQSINMHFRVGKLTIAGSALTDFLGKLLPIVIIVVGAQEDADAPEPGDMVELEVPKGLDPNGGVKGKRKSKKDKLREAAARGD